MNLTGLHLLISYQCNYECDHCFVWGSPWQYGTMSLKDIEDILRQAQELGSIEWIYFEGGEAFLFYAILKGGVQKAAEMGFKVGIVTNGYWATTVEDAVEWLEPFAGLVQDLSVSDDFYHGNTLVSHAREAAESLGIPVNSISIAQPETTSAAGAVGQIPSGQSRVMYRGRAAVKLVSRAVMYSWDRFDTCPYEKLSEPDRIHVDPFGNLHICQGISLGNLFLTPLTEICANFAPEEDPILGPLIEGGPAELARRHEISPRRVCADACHLCYETRLKLRTKFPEILHPDHMYSVPG